MQQNSRGFNSCLVSAHCIILIRLFPVYAIKHATIVGAASRLDTNPSRASDRKDGVLTHRRAIFMAHQIDATAKIFEDM
jgi:hypothetical protein